MKKRFLAIGGLAAVAATATALGPIFRTVRADNAPPSSYSPVVIKETFKQIRSRMEGEKPTVMKRQLDLLAERYELANHAAPGATMSRGKPLQGGARAKLPSGVTWEQLGSMSPEQIREKNLFPTGFFPLPHPHHAEGGMIFPEFHIKEIQKQEARDLTRFDLDYDIPEHFLPEFPPAIYLTRGPTWGTSPKGSSSRSRTLRVVQRRF